MREQQPPAVRSSQCGDSRPRRSSRAKLDRFATLESVRARDASVTAGTVLVGAAGIEPATVGLETQRRKMRKAACLLHFVAILGLGWGCFYHYFATTGGLRLLQLLQGQHFIVIVDNVVPPKD